MNRFSRILAVLYFITVLPDAYGFIFIRAGVFQKGERPISRAPAWSTRQVNFVINTNQAAYGGSIAPELTPAEFRSAVESAVSAWANICNSDITVTLTGTTASTRNSADGVNTITWDSRTTGEGNAIASTSTLAVAYSAVNSGTDLYSDCDIVVNGEATGNFGIGGESNLYDLISIMAHEIGHCLGLDHSVEPPTFTSTNSILLKATMASTVSAGDINGRSLSQDEIDGMECVNPSGASFRSGSRCGSYHGTGGSGALSGTVSGGPSSEVTCGLGSSASIIAGPGTPNESGGGCITKAAASQSKGVSPRKRNAGDLIGSWFFEILALGAIYFLYRMRGRLGDHDTAQRNTILKMFLAVQAISMIASAPSHALFSAELGFQHRWSNPRLLQKGAEITSNEGTFSKVEPKEAFTRANDLYGQGMMDFFGILAVGGFLRFQIPQTKTQQGRNASNELQLTKTSELSGFTVGPAARIYLFGPQSQVPVFAEAQVGLGKVNFKQSIADGSGSTAQHTLSATAMAFETTLNAGIGYNILSRLSVVGKLGYSRYRTNALSADSVSGTRYSGVSQGKRLYVNDGGKYTELSVDLSGVVASVAIMLTL